MCYRPFYCIERYESSNSIILICHKYVSTCENERQSRNRAGFLIKYVGTILVSLLGTKVKFRNEVYSQCTLISLIAKGDGINKKGRKIQKETDT